MSDKFVKEYNALGQQQQSLAEQFQADLEKRGPEAISTWTWVIMSSIIQYETHVDNPMDQRMYEAIGYALLDVRPKVDKIISMRKFTDPAQIDAFMQYLDFVHGNHGIVSISKKMIELAYDYLVSNGYPTSEDRMIEAIQRNVGLRNVGLFVRDPEKSMTWFRSTQAYRERKS